MVRKYPYLLALAVISLFWGLLLILSGTPFSGYQLVDDHEFLRMKEDLNAPGAGFVPTLRKWLARDLTMRCRPLYYLHRLAMVRLIDSDFELWALHHGIVAILTSFLLFAFCMRTGFAWGESLLLPLISLVGPQSSIYWRYGPQETIGTLLAALCMFMMALSVVAQRCRRLYEVAFLLTAIAMSLQKESFFLLLPTLAFWKVWLTKQFCAAPSWYAALRANVAPVAVLLAVPIAEVAFVYFRIGTTLEGYAGVDRFAPVQFLITVWAAFNRFEFYLIFLGLFAVLCFNLERRKRLDRDSVTFIRQFLPIIALFVLIVLPQGVLYAKSGMSERYRIPAIFGFAFFIVWLCRYLRENHRYFLVIYVAVLLLHSGARAKVAFVAAQQHVAVGALTNRFFETIEQCTEKHSRILVVGDSARNYEAFMATRDYLRIKMGRPNLYALAVFAPPYTAFEQYLAARDKLSEWFPGRVVTNLEQIPTFDCVAVLFGADRPFLKDRPPWLTSAGYERVNYGGEWGLTVYRRRAAASDTAR